MIRLLVRLRELFQLLTDSLAAISTLLLLIFIFVFIFAVCGMQTFVDDTGEGFYETGDKAISPPFNPCFTPI